MNSKEGLILKKRCYNIFFLQIGYRSLCNDDHIEMAKTVLQTVPNNFGKFKM